MGVWWVLDCFCVSLVFFSLAGFSSYIPPAERSLPKNLMRATIVFSAFPSCNSQPYVLRCGCCSSFAKFKRKTMQDSWFCIASQEAKKGKPRKTQLEPKCYLAKKEEKTKESKGKQLVLESQWFHRLWETLGPNILSKQSSQLLPWKTSAPPLEQRPPGPPGWNSRRMPHAGHPTATVRCQKCSSPESNAHERYECSRMFQVLKYCPLALTSWTTGSLWASVGDLHIASLWIHMNPYESIQSIPCVHHIHHIHHETPWGTCVQVQPQLSLPSHTRSISRVGLAGATDATDPWDPHGSPWERLRPSLVVIQ